MKQTQGRMIALTSELIGLIVFSVYFGKYVDEKFDLGSIALISLLMGTFILWVVRVMWMKNKTNDDQ